MGIDQMSWRHPFNKKLITSRFGTTANRLTAHRGLDYAPKEGTRIPAASSGTVQSVRWSAILGWVLVQSAWDSIKGRTVYIGYCHLQEKPALAVGAKIIMGQTVGKCGNTGSASKGAHLHLTIGPRVTSVTMGVVFDPEKFIDEQIANA
jgi:murein DD-endopeptidase MepM/ murein hydrolase activator NlpD